MVLIANFTIIIIVILFALYQVISLIRLSKQGRCKACQYECENKRALQNHKNVNSK